MNKKEFRKELVKLEKNLKNRLQSYSGKDNNIEKYDYENNSIMKLEYEKQLNVTLIPISIVSVMYMYYQSTIINDYEIVLLVLLLFIVKAISLQFKIYKAKIALGCIRIQKKEGDDLYKFAIMLFEDKKNRMVDDIVKSNNENENYIERLNGLIDYTNQIYKEYFMKEPSDSVKDMYKKIVVLGKLTNYLDILILSIFIMIGMLAVIIFMSKTQYNNLTYIVVGILAMFLVGIFIEKRLYNFKKK